ncbi:arylsulfatase [Prosthecobacter debontii]|uniref:Arylsulfatase n=1 Tax=Prosthecobacter debontii TaxID=48467 RepID=A0A1T4XT41_9BACT|nr:sulfatase [Prosthecobacter debontii]SKA92712.1 arylsulfatase [Prosthecobacter debontii]
MFLRICFLSLALLSLSHGQESPVGTPPDSTPAEPKPNIILIVADDLGYSDLGCYGSTTIRTPNLDKMAAEGTRFTSFLVAQAVCTASRAALMTGCYPNRVGLQGALNHTSLEGINPDEQLMPEILKKQGYATAIYGKWHLGTADLFHPMKNGFDEFWGIPYSNDNSKYHPSLASEMPPLPLYENEKVIETDPDQSLFTRRITEKSVSFIRRHKAQPFFLYVPHIMPHVPIFAADRFRGKSPHGLYADVVEELDWSAGMIVAAVEQAGLSENTLIIFMSDNGPFLSYGNHAGNAAPRREGKLTSYDGGVGVPFIARWPGKVPTGKVNDELFTAMDLLPTFISWIGAEKPTAKIDGRDVSGILHGAEGAKSPHEAIAIYAGSELQAIRSGEWKLHFDHPYITPHEPRGKDGKPANWENMKPVAITQSGIEGIASRHGYRVAQQALALYNVKDDVGETTDVSAKHPDIVERLKKLAEPFRVQLGDGLTQTQASEARPRGKAEKMKDSEMR